jgi:hypothetical protein
MASGPSRDASEPCRYVSPSVTSRAINGKIGRAPRDQTEAIRRDSLMHRQEVCLDQVCRALLPHPLAQEWSEVARVSWRCTHLPTAHDQRLVNRALVMFTPWDSAHVPPSALSRSMLASHFDRESPRPDWSWIHTLIDPAGAGLTRLIREHNQQFPTGSALRLEDPAHILAISSL